MMNKKKKSILISIILFIAILAFVSTLLISGKSFFSDRRVLQINWGIEITDSLKIDYVTSTERSFTGDGTSIYVLEIENEENLAYFDLNQFTKKVDEEQLKFIQYCINNLDAGDNNLKEKYPILNDVNNMLNLNFRLITKHESQLLTIYEPVSNNYFLFELLT